MKSCGIHLRAIVYEMLLMYCYILDIDGLMQERHNSMATSLELHFFYTKASIYKFEYYSCKITATSPRGPNSRCGTVQFARGQWVPPARLDSIWGLLHNEGCVSTIIWDVNLLFDVLAIDTVYSIMIITCISWLFKPQAIKTICSTACVSKQQSSCITVLVLCAVDLPVTSWISLTNDQ